MSTKHLVLGWNGNLGASLSLALNQRGLEQLPKMYMRYPNDPLVEVVKYRNPDIIWVALGAGSVGGNFTTQLQCHLNLIVELVEACPNAKIIAFSTSFICDEEDPSNPRKQGKPKSLYAFSKKLLEDYAVFTNNPNLRVIRVTNLYGHHKFENTFPGRLLPERNNLKVLPTNLVTPTPTDDLADKLVTHLDDIFNSEYPILNAAPKGSVTVADWGRLIIPNVQDGQLDPLRPKTCEIGSFFEWENWKTLWLKNNK